MLRCNNVHQKVRINDAKTSSARCPPPHPRETKFGNQLLIVPFVQLLYRVCGVVVVAGPFNYNHQFKLHMRKFVICGGVAVHHRAVEREVSLRGRDVMRMGTTTRRS